MAYTESDCIEAIQKTTAELGHSPTMPEYWSMNLSPSTQTIHNIMGSWNEAKAAAGVEQHQSGFTESDCVRAIRKAANRLGHSPSAPEYQELGISPSCSIIYTIMDGWNSAKKAAGLDIQKNYTPRTVNDGYFKNIDSVETSYWLGFLYADGSVRPATNQVQLTLQDADSAHVKAFSNTLGSDYSIINYTHPRKGYKSTRTVIYSPEMVSDVRSFGVGPGKAYTSDVPDIDDRFINPFIRGLFDGDGGFYIDDDRPVWALTGSSRDRLVWVGEQIQKADVQPNLYSRETKTGSEICNLKVYANSDVRKLGNLLYPNGVNTEPALSRKKQKICRFIFE